MVHIRAVSGVPTRLPQHPTAHHPPLMQKYFALAGNGSGNARKVLKWFKQGATMNFVGVGHHSHEHAPQFRQKMDAVRSMLTKTIGGEKVDHYLWGVTLLAVQLPNHTSVEQYDNFVQVEIESCLKKEVIKKWTVQEPPTIVNGLKMVDDKPEKLRLCLNPLYINAFMAYELVKNEQLQDLVDMVEQDDYLICKGTQ